MTDNPLRDALEHMIKIAQDALAEFDDKAEDAELHDKLERSIEMKKIPSGRRT